MFKIFTLPILLTIATLAYGPVLKTGQTLSYDENGTIVTYGSIKDDGYYQAGVNRSYSRNGDVVIDNATGLEWQDNETLQKTLDAAITYCIGLTLDGGGWLLPTIEELETLMNVERANPSVTEGVFQHISSSSYWSSTGAIEDTEYIDDNVYMWCGDFFGGLSFWSVNTGSNYVRCVRGGE